jgi:cyclic pyranopterin phosphate synthase
MPEEGLDWFDNQKLLTFDEIERIVKIVVGMGVTEIRLTGGEPLVRKGLPKLIERLSKIGGLEDLSLTTNGFLLKELAGDLAAAGLRRINVSLDSLVKEKFFKLTRRNSLHKVMEGLEEAEKYPQLRPIKVNVVAMKGFTEGEIIDFAKLARRKPYVIRFIEFMPLEADRIWKKKDVLTGQEILEKINTYKKLVPTGGDDPSSTSRNYRFEDGIGRIGFINPVSEPFCSTCNRIRVTADGMFRTCLFSHIETDLRTPLRNGCSDKELEQILSQAVKGKELKHHINDNTFKRTARTMSQIGG